MDKKTKIKFNILAIFAIIIFCFAITPKTLQNDTYYTIKNSSYQYNFCAFLQFILYFVFLYIT